MLPNYAETRMLFQLSGSNLICFSAIKLVSTNNSADIAESVLYGGAIDNCKLTINDWEYYNTGKICLMDVFPFCGQELLTIYVATYALACNYKIAHCKV